MGKTSSQVKDRYNAKAYDNFLVRVPKGKKEDIAAHAQAKGESLNKYVTTAIDERVRRDKATTGKSIEPEKEIPNA